MILIFVSCVSASLLVHFDQQGLQQTITNGLKLLEGQVFHLDVGVASTIPFGSIRMTGIDISQISTGQHQIKVLLNPKLNSIDFWVNIDSLIVTTDLRVKFAGAALINKNSQIKVTNTKLSGRLILSENQGSLKISMSSFDTFKIGKMHLLGGKPYQIPLFRTINVLLNQIDKVEDRIVAKKLVSIINDYGSKIPSSIDVKGVHIEFPLIKAIVTNSQVQIDFQCGTTASQPDDNLKDFVSIGVSEQCASYVLQQVYNSYNLDLNIIVQQLSEVMEINTRTFGGVFPEFRNMKKIYDLGVAVKFNTNEIPHIKIQESITVIAPLILDFSLVDGATIYDSEGFHAKYNPDLESQYYSTMSASARVDLGIENEGIGFHGDIQAINLNNVKADSKVDFEEWDYIQDVFLRFGLSYANQVVYQKFIAPVNGFQQYVQVNLTSGLMNIKLQF